MSVSTRSGNKFRVKYWERKDKCKQSSHKTITTCQAKQTLNMGGNCIVSHQINPFTIYLQAFCETALEIARVSLSKSSNTMSFLFLSISPAFCSAGSEFFPESDSSPQIQGWDFFLREDSLRPLGCNSSRNVAMGEQNPIRNMKFIF